MEEAAKTTDPSDASCSPATNAAQERNGSRCTYTRTERNGGWETSVTAELAEFLAELDMFYLATATAHGQLDVQYHGGPPGFLRVLDGRPLAFAGFGGNGQHPTLGNLSENPKAFLFLMDYANRRRVKVWGTARMADDDPTLLAMLDDPADPGRVGRAVVFAVVTWEVNCPQHIHPRYSRRLIASAVLHMHKRIAELEAAVERLKANPNPE